LEANAGLRMLLTSREGLRLRGEREFPLSPLALPDQAGVEILLGSPSIALFIQRAQAHQPDFEWTAENASAVAEICARLDGLPLAIELAAARIRLLPPKTMLARLQESSLQLLTSGARDLPARQQTLHNAVQWSYDLLNDDEQRMFRWVSVFVSGCTLEAASRVTGSQLSAISDQSAVVSNKGQATGHWSTITLDLVTLLVDKNLLRQTERGDEPRVTMLETIHEFGLEKLSSAHELDSARRAHAAYYLSFAEDAEQELTGANQKMWLWRMDREQDNLRAALHWAIEYHEGEMAQRMAGALQPFWFARGRWSEGRRWLEESLAMDSGAAQDQSVRAKVLYGAGMLARHQGDLARARMLCEQGLELYRALGDKTGMLKALVQLSRIADFQDDQSAKNAFLSEAASLIEDVPDTVAKASAYTDMALAMMDLAASPFHPDVVRYVTESERIHRALNNQSGVALANLHQAIRAFLEGDLTLAASRFDEAERMARELGNDRLLSRLAVRALLEVRQGDFAAARRRLEDAIQQDRNRGDQQLPGDLKMLAIVLHAQGLDAWSARVMGLSEVFPITRASLAGVAAITQRSRIGDVRAEVRAELGDEAFAREFAAGQHLTIDDLLAIPHPPPSVQPALPSTPGTALTAREHEVLRLLAKDLSNPQIAERLVVSRRTVDAHLRSIYDKLGVKSRDAALRVAREQALLGK
jgi:predicted ATPase/DNA-binding CsgD family transcriptional regulator